MMICCTTADCYPLAALKRNLSSHAVHAAWALTSSWLIYITISQADARPAYNVDRHTGMWSALADPPLLCDGQDARFEMLKCTLSWLGDPGSATSSSRAAVPDDGRLGTVSGGRAARPLLRARGSDPTMVRAASDQRPAASITTATCRGRCVRPCCCRRAYDLAC